MRIDIKIPSIFIRAISVLLVLTFITGQVSASQISSFRSTDTLAASVVSDSKINPGRSDPVRNNIAGKTEPGAIGNGMPLKELAQGNLPPKATLSTDEFDRIAAKLNPAIDKAIARSLINQNNIPSKHRNRFKQALYNLIDLQSRLKKAYLFNADIRTPEDYLVGFNFNENIGLSLELIDRLSIVRLAQYIFHECVPEKGIISEMDDHRVVYNEIQSAIFGEDEVLALKVDLREFINGEAAGKAAETPATATEQIASKISANQIKIGNTNIGVVQGDITRVSSEAVVPGVNTSMAVGMGVTGAIIRAVGVRNAAKVFPPAQVAIGKRSFKIGDAYAAPLGDILTAAGWKYVISAMIHVGEPWSEPTEESVRTSTKNALIEANKVGVQSITFPAFGTGLLGMDFNTSARSIYAGIKDFLAQNPKTSITDIKVVLFDEPAGAPFKEELNRLVGQKERAKKDVTTSTNWKTIEEEFNVLIDNATTRDELKRVYRQIALQVHPDKNPGDEKNTEAVFKRLAERVTTRLERDFDIKVPRDRDVKEDFGYGWVTGWAAAAAFYAEDNENVMGEAVKALQKRARRITKEGERKLIPLAQALSRIASVLSVNDLEGLLDIASKERFANELMGEMPAGDLSRENISNETLWEARPMLERLVLARRLQGGEIVHLRRGNEIIRTVILEPMTEKRPRLRVIMVTPPFGLFVMELPKSTFEIEASEIVAPTFDIEREPLQKGWHINIGDQLEIKLEGSDFIKNKIVATVIAAYGGSYTMIARERVHDEFDHYSGHGIIVGKGHAANELKAGKIRKVLPSPINTLALESDLARMQAEGAVTTTVQAPAVSNYFEGISEGLPVHAEVFAANLTRISRILAEHPDQLFFVGVETDIGESQKTQIMPIYKAIDQIENMTDNNTGKRLFPNLIVRRAKAGELVTMVRDLNKEGKLNLNNAFIGARKINVDNKAYDAIKGEGRAWISAIDDSRPGDYLPVFEAITMNMMAYLNADLSAIKNFYDAISDKPIDPDVLQDYIKNRIIYILPKATAFDTKQLRELYELAHQVYIAA